MSRLAVAASALAIATGIAAAAEFPTIAIERTCRTAQPLDSQDTQPVEHCTQEEREARAQLEAQWAKFAADKQRLCVEQTNLGGYPSYVEVLTCLQMYEWGASGAAPRPKRRFGQ